VHKQRLQKALGVPWPVTEYAPYISQSTTIILVKYYTMAITVSIIQCQYIGYISKMYSRRDVFSATAEFLVLIKCD